MPSPGVHLSQASHQAPNTSTANADLAKAVLANPKSIQNLSPKQIQALIQMLQQMVQQMKQGPQQAKQTFQTQNQTIPPKLAQQAPKVLPLLTQALAQKTQAEPKQPNWLLGQNQAAGHLAQSGKSTNLSAAKTTPLMLPGLSKAISTLQQQNLPPQQAAQALINLLSSPQLAGQLARLLQSPQGLASLIQSFNPQLANPQMAQAMMQALGNLISQKQLPATLQNLSQVAAKALAMLGQPGQNLAQLASMQPQALNALLMTLSQGNGAGLGKGMENSLMLFSQALFGQMALAQPALVANDAMLAALAALMACRNQSRPEDLKKGRLKKKKLYALQGASEADLEEEEEENYEELEEDFLEKSRQKAKRRRRKAHPGA